jgi:hypothetical protein
MKRAFVLLLATLGWLGGSTCHAQKNDYSDANNWLCRPGRADACSGVLTATVIQADGSRSERTYKPDPNAPVDCFYVYPTVSRERTGNSDMALGDEEEHAAQNQFARFGEACRTYAPLYRQITLAGLRGQAHINPALAYGDVLDAWKSYLRHDNDGRGVVLIGHSQGARILKHLIATEIDGKPEQAKLVSAILLGTDIEVPKGRMVGDTFRNIALCERKEQTGCVIAYSSFLSTMPPDANAEFGISHGNAVYACVNPGNLTDEGKLEAELPAVGDVKQMFGTTFVENPGMFSAKCVEEGNRSYLAISIGEGAGSRRVEEHFMAIQQSLPGWGLHILDVNLALGNLVDLVREQGKEWIAVQKDSH